jgi:hypothetical protein
MFRSRVVLAPPVVLFAVQSPLFGQPTAQKVSDLEKVVLTFDLTQNMGMISWTEDGISENPMCIASLSNPMPINFPVATGQKANAANGLCGQSLNNNWDVKGVLENGKTKFVAKSNPRESGVVQAKAKLNQAGSAGSSTTVKVSTFTAGPVMAKIKSGGTKDKFYTTSVAGDTDSHTSVGETIKVTDDSGTPIEIDLGAGSESGGAAKLDHTGLYLYATGGSQLAGFSGTVYSHG